MNEEQDAPRFAAHAFRSVGETKPPKRLKFLIANLELEFQASPIRISDLKFSNRKKTRVLRAPWRIAVCIVASPSPDAPPARAPSRFDAPGRIPYNRGILSARQRARRRLVYKVVEDRIRKALRHHIHERYKTDVPIATERPPKLAMGEAASPVCFELAKRLKKPLTCLSAGNREFVEADSRRCASRSSWRRISQFFLRPRRIFYRRTHGVHAETRRPPVPTHPRQSSSTPPSTRTKPRTSATCATRCWATPSCASFAMPAGTSRFRITSTTPASRSRM